MKILFFIDSLAAGGKERRLVELMKQLKNKNDINFELVLLKRDIHYKEILNLGIPVHYIERKSKKDVSVFFKIFRLCRKYKPEIVHCWDSMTAVYLLPVAFFLRCKVINSMVADVPVNANYKNKDWFRARFTFPFSNLIIGNSLAGLKAYRAPQKKSICIYNGFNFERVDGLQASDAIKAKLDIDTQFTVGMTASFSKYKDYVTYYKAAELLLDKRNDITFVAIGTDTDSPASKQNITKEKLKHFRLLGAKTGIESYIHCMDICVLATYTEGISNSIMEYMALKKPVVATDGGGTNEIVENNITGFLVSQENPEELADRIQTLLNDENLRLQMGVEGKKRIQDKFSIGHMMDKYISSYKSLIRK